MWSFCEKYRNTIKRYELFNRFDSNVTFSDERYKRFEDYF